MTKKYFGTDGIRGAINSKHINGDIFLKGWKMEIVDREKFMVEIWKQYNATKDIEFLAKACEEAPFFGQKEMAFEIARILRSVKKK